MHGQNDRINFPEKEPFMKAKTTACVLAALMCVAAVAGVAAEPTALRLSQIALAQDVPDPFGGWTHLVERAR